MLLLIASLGLSSAATGLAGTQRLVAPWALTELEERVRADPQAEDLHDLAELWARIAEDEEHRALEVYVAAFDACVDTAAQDADLSRADCEGLEPDLAVATAAWQRSAIRSMQLLRDHPGDPGVPEAIDRLAWAWLHLGQARLASAAFTWVAASEEDPARAQAAWVGAGEVAFRGWELDEAVVAYGQAAELDGPLGSWALHRRAWSFYRLGELGFAIDTLKSLVWRSMQAREAGEPDPYELSDLALKDLVRFFADAEGPPLTP